MTLDPEKILYKTTDAGECKTIHKLHLFEHLEKLSSEIVLGYEFLPIDERNCVMFHNWVKKNVHKKYRYPFLFWISSNILSDTISREGHWKIIILWQ